MYKDKKCKELIYAHLISEGLYKLREDAKDTEMTFK